MKRLVSLACLLLLGGCGTPVPAPVLLTLPPIAAEVAAAPPGSLATMPHLAVRRVAIPEYLVARRVRYRADPATLAEWPDTYWAERIEIGVTREFTSALRQQLPGWDLCQTSCGDQEAGLTLQVDLVPMDYLRGARSLQGRAHVTVSAPTRMLVTREFAYDIPSTADSAQAQAQAISTLLQRVAADAAPLVREARR
jgi:uncharacterized lipoprotein YmbA